LSPVAVFVCEARALLWTIASLVQHHSAQARARTHARRGRSKQQREGKELEEKKDAERASSSEAFSVTHFKR